MSDMANAIMDAAERRIRAAGYNGFSFREIAADVGVKSASVHYHFPTKERLAAAVASRYTDRFLKSVESRVATGADTLEAWKGEFRRALAEDGQMCLCGALGASARNLPAEVITEVRAFFKRGIDLLTSSGMSVEKAMGLFATLEGAMLMANTFGDARAFDQATSIYG
ncbi:helix-turn-helix domain-containing protein [Sinorhizobium sp. 8-89]|uniref:TetR/AcrR family transcriptional regulator n=1 Tax=Sinorhizobium sp. 7-81 TaxID=3049087 RepID=UPI0024C3DEBF|nr:helix-turn-helix domain-containing protein [Sinorhizobium sp. 7-81]MDK1386544.1 helix-turn-helix domain-containing protein [Sinorhizobium sp. 7-81]